MTKKVVIIGAGKIGLALGGVLKTVGHEVAWWDVLPDKVADQKPLVEILPEADFVFYCVPSSALRSALTNSYAHLSPTAIVVSLTKGIEAGTHKLADELLTELLPTSQAVAVLGGPLLAEELTKGNYAFGVAGAKTQTTAEAIKNLLAETKIKVSLLVDPHAVALAGVLKNIYTFALGFSDALGLGDNTRGFFAVKAMDEMEAIFSVFKLDQKPLISEAGLGDFIATATSDSSRNRQAAGELATTGRSATPSEGILSIESLIFLLGGNISSYPLLHTLAEIILDHADARELLARFIVEHGGE